MKFKIAALLAGLVLAAFAARHYRLYDRLFDPRFHFVSARGTSFYLEGEPFRFVGANTRLLHGPDQRQRRDEALANAERDGVRVVRQWALGECPAPDTAVHKPAEAFYFQAGPNNWQEQSFVHLDSLMASAERHGLKVVLTLANNWSDYGGIPMYLYWAGLADHPGDDRLRHRFYTEPQIRTWFENFVRELVLRRNTVTGRLYRDDPTLFAWELVNEQATPFHQIEAMQDWLRHMAAFVKDLDPNHLVSTSFSLYERLLIRDYIISSFQLEQLDYCDIHFYASAPHQRFLFADAEAVNQVIDDLVHIAHDAVGKPLVIGELGFSRFEPWLGRSREHWFERVLDHSLKKGAAGVLLWSYSIPDWRDAFEINWRRPEDDQVRQLMARYGARFATAPPKRPIAAPGTSAFRVPLRIHRFERPPNLPRRLDDRLEYRIPVTAYTGAQWINMGYWDQEKGFASVYAKDHGFFEYSFSTARAETLSAVHLKVRLSTDFPPVPGADSLGLSDLTVAINSTPLGTLRIKPQRFFGTVFDLHLERDFGHPVLVLPPGQHHLTFAVPQDAAHRNGIAILGAATSDRYRSEEIPILLTLFTMHKP